MSQPNAKKRKQYNRPSILTHTQEEAALAKELLISQIEEMISDPDALSIFLGDYLGQALVEVRDGNHPSSLMLLSAALCEAIIETATMLNQHGSKAVQ